MGNDFSKRPIDDQARVARAVAQSLGQRSSADFTEPAELADCFAGKSPKFFYARQESPWVKEFEMRFAQMEGGAYALAMGTGMGAIKLAHDALLEKGRSIVYSRNIFGTTVNLFEKHYPHLGFTTVPVNLTNIDSWQQAIELYKPKVVFLETPSNPKTELGDIAAISEIAKANKDNKTIVVVDSTFSTPIFQHPLALGADVVVHSTTKYIDGQGNTLGGVAVTNDYSLLGIPLYHEEDCWLHPKRV